MVDGRGQVLARVRDVSHEAETSRRGRGRVVRHLAAGERPGRGEPNQAEGYHQVHHCAVRRECQCDWTPGYWGRWAVEGRGSEDVELCGVLSRNRNGRSGRRRCFMYRVPACGQLAFRSVAGPVSMAPSSDLQDRGSPGTTRGCASASTSRPASTRAFPAPPELPVLYYRVCHEV